MMVTTQDMLHNGLCTAVTLRINIKVMEQERQREREGEGGRVGEMDQ